MQISPDISEVELNEYLFDHFPDYLSFEEMQDELELAIEQTAEYLRKTDFVGLDNSDVDDDEEMKTEFSPYWIFMADRYRAHREIRKMTAAERSNALADAYARFPKLARHKQ